MKYLIYSIEDDKDIAYIMNTTLAKQGYEVRSFYNAKTFFAEMDKQVPNMILLDIMLPDMNGNDILNKIRQNPKYDDIKIIIISANKLVTDKVYGFDLGADDYIEKPFDLLEFMSRINAHVRRHKKERIIKIEDLTIDIDKREVKKNDVLINLTNKEFDVLSLLSSNPGKVFSREDILNYIWGIDMLESRTVDMHVKSLRKKLEGDYIQTIYGVGYKISV